MSRPRSPRALTRAGGSPNARRHGRVPPPAGPCAGGRPDTLAGAAPARARAMSNRLRARAVPDLTYCSQRSCSSHSGLLSVLRCPQFRYTGGEHFGGAAHAALLLRSTRPSTTKRASRCRTSRRPRNTPQLSHASSWRPSRASWVRVGKRGRSKSATGSSNGYSRFLLSRLKARTAAPVMTRHSRPRLCC